MKRAVISVCLLLITVDASPANDFRNGDFSEGKKYWFGQCIKVEEDPSKAGNKHLVVKLEKRKELAIFTHAFPARLEGSVMISFEVTPSPDFKGKGFEVRMDYPDGQSLRVDLDAPPATGKQYKIPLGFKKSSRPNVLYVVLKDFEGSLMFDNFVTTPR